MIDVNHTNKSDPVSLAVLPFDNLTGIVEQDYFTRGFVEDIITDLSRFSNLETIASNTIQALEQEKKSEYSIVQKLKTQYLLKGNLRKFGEKLRINTQLINAHNNRVLWAEKFGAPPVQMSSDYLKLMEKGLTLKSIQYEMGQENEIVNTVKVEIKDISDTEFQVPAGYKKVNMTDYFGSQVRGDRQ